MIVVDLAASPVVTWARPLLWSADVADALREFVPNVDYTDAAWHFGSCDGAYVIAKCTHADGTPMCSVYAVATEEDGAYRFVGIELEQAKGIVVALSKFQHERLAGQTR